MANKMKRKEVRLPTANPNRAATEDQNLQNKRLKSLYDAIDAGRNKDSIDIAEKLVRKFGSKDRGTLNDRITVNTAQALKALALIRAENTAEAAVLVENCEQALVSGEFNEGTLQVLFHCFKESYIPNRIPQLIEKILKTQPASEPLLLDLYFGYARVMDFKNQQRVANLLYKDYENWKYLFWAVNSLIMQANASPALADKMFYPLAQRMLEKVASDERKPNRTEIVLNYHVLLERKSYDKAFEYLARHSADMNKQDSKAMEFELMKMSEQYDQLFDYVSEEIQMDKLSFTNWETLFWIYEKSSKAGNAALQKRAIDILDRLSREHLFEEDKVSKQYSHVLKLLFLKQLYTLGHVKQIGEITSKFGTVLENLKQFVLLSYNRPNCFADLSKFLHLLNDTEKEELLAFVDQEFKDQFESMSNAFFIRELLRTGFGFYRRLDIKQRQEFLIKLASNLRATNSKDSPDLDTHAKATTLIVANVLWDSYTETGSKLYLYQMAAFLEFIFDRCSNVYIAAIVLMRVYTILGNMSRIVALFNQLDIKYFQRDSLGYLTFASAMQFGRFREAIYYYTSVTAQFDHNEREISESIVTAYKVCNLDQIPRLVEFSEHCRSSIYALCADILNQLLSACFAVDHLHFALITLRGDDDRTDWSKVTDSRDFGILQTVSLVDERITETAKKLGFSETLDYIKLLHALGRVVSDVGVANLPNASFDADLAALHSHLAYCKSVYSESEVSKYLQGFGATQVVSFVSNPFLEPLIQMLQLASQLFALESQLGDKKAAFSQLVSFAEHLTKDIKFDSMIQSCNAQNQSFADFMEHCTHSILSMSLCELLVKFMEARVSALLQKLDKDLTLDKIEKLAIQQQEIMEHLQSLKVTPREPVDTANETDESGGKKTKKVQAKPKTFDELSDEQKIASSFKFVQKNLLTVCQTFEQQIVNGSERLNKITDFFEGHEGEQIDFKAASLERQFDFVNRSLLDSHARSLDDLRIYTGRIQFFATLPRFSLLNIHFSGSGTNASPPLYQKQK